MAERCVTRVPFGPQHIVLPEPVHFDLRVEDEVVVEAGFRLGFAHRGIERAFQLRDMYSALFIAERICGICSSSHSNAMSGVLEKLCGIEIPDNARYVRTLMAELDRIHSHLLILGHIGETMGFENLFMLTWRDREFVMDMLELLTGNRVNHGMNTIGGVRRRVTSAVLKQLGGMLDEFERRWPALAEVYTKDSGFIHRTRGVGIIPREVALAAGVVGPNARASGVDLDIRKKHYFAYGDLKFRPVRLDEPRGDVYDRVQVRVREVNESLRMVRELIGMVDENKPFAVEKGPRKLPEDECFFNVEAPRGELFYFARGNGTGKPARIKVRTPTLATLRAVIMILKGMEIQHVPLTVISIDPCICCTER
ncbi:MAG: nickel-dependent hydrogenase large subunit [Thermoplasmata archaeon]